MLASSQTVHCQKCKDTKQGCFFDRHSDPRKRKLKVKIKVATDDALPKTASGAGSETVKKQLGKQKVIESSPEPLDAGSSNMAIPPWKKTSTSSLDCHSIEVEDSSQIPQPAKPFIDQSFNSLLTDFYTININPELQSLCDDI